jgi:hypothetical protein
MKRGRPKEAHVEPTQAPSRFTREFTNNNGHRSVWTYDLNKSLNGPISVEVFYPKGSKEEPNETDESIPKTKRKYYNPKNGKLVAYTRAKELGIIK